MWRSKESIFYRKERTIWNQILMWEGAWSSKKRKASERTKSKRECREDDEVCGQSGATEGG